MIYTVIQQIVGTEKVDVQFYTGTNLAEAMGAMAMAACHQPPVVGDEPTYTVLGVTLTIEEECVWRTDQYQPWARLPCSGAVKRFIRQNQAGFMCDAHIKAWDSQINRDQSGDRRNDDFFDKAFSETYCVTHRSYHGEVEATCRLGQRG